MTTYREDPEEIAEVGEHVDHVVARQGVNATHTWIQRGPYVVCTACPFEHGRYIGTDQQLTGIDAAGLPVIKQRA